jgi:uncharacterized protein (UPF0548 family)
MNLLLPGRPEPLDAWIDRPFSPGSETGPSARDLPLSFERDLGREPPGAPLPDGAFARVARAVLAYEIFPAETVRGVLRRAPVQVGDTIGISYRLGGGVRLFFAARVFDRFDGLQPDGRFASGFRYRTLAGHPELGEETFEVAKDPRSGSVRVALRSWSRAGLWLTWVGTPIMRLAQRRASEAALDALAKIAASAPTAGPPAAA